MTATQPRSTRTGQLIARANQIREAEMKRLLERTTGSARLFERATRSLPFGVVSSFQKMQPYPIYLSHGKASRVWDQDGHEYRDFHGGFGAMVVGHAHPRIVQAVQAVAILIGVRLNEQTPAR